MQIEVFSRKKLLGGSQWYFRIRHGNGKVLAQSEGYSRRLDAVGTATTLKNKLADAEIKDA